MDCGVPDLSGLVMTDIHHLYLDNYANYTPTP